MSNTAVVVTMMASQEDQRRAVIAAAARRRRKGTSMNNELLESYVGRKCVLTLGTSGGSAKGVLLRVQENWLEIEEKWGTRLINADHVSAIHSKE